WLGRPMPNSCGFLAFWVRGRYRDWAGAMALATSGMSDSSPKSTRPRSHRRGGRSEWFDEAAGLVVSTSLAALGIAVVDQVFRPQWEHSWADHWKGAPILYFAP